jgi:hypothetical protein
MDFDPTCYFEHQGHTISVRMIGWSTPEINGGREDRTITTPHVFIDGRPYDYPGGTFASEADYQEKLRHYVDMLIRQGALKQIR